MTTSTIDPAVPISGAPVASAPVRANFQAAYNDVNSLWGALTSGLAGLPGLNVANVWTKDQIISEAGGAAWKLQDANTSDTWYMAVQGATWELTTQDFSIILSANSVSKVATFQHPPIFTSGPLPITQGGTGANNAGAALTNLGGISLSGSNVFTGNNTFQGASGAQVTFLSTGSGFTWYNIARADGTYTLDYNNGSGTANCWQALTNGDLWVNHNLQLNNPLSIANGGTGATSAGAALTNLGGIALSANNAFTGNNTFNQDVNFLNGKSLRLSNSGSTHSSFLYFDAGAITFQYEDATQPLKIDVASGVASFSHPPVFTSGQLAIAYGGTGSGTAGGARIALAAAGLADNNAFTGTNSFSNTVTLSAGATITPAATPATNAAGYLGVPQGLQATSRTLAMTDCGKEIMFTVTGQTLTVPPNSSVAFPIGTTIEVSANTGVNVTIAAGAGVVFVWIPSGDTANRTLSGPASSTLQKKATDIWWISGVGLS